MEGPFESAESLVKQISQEGNEAKRRLGLAKLTELCRTPSGRRAVVNSGGLLRLVKLLNGRQSMMRVGAAHALCNIARDKEYHNDIVKHGAVKSFAQLLHDTTKEHVCAGAVNLANLSRNSNFVKLVLTEMGGPKALSKLLKTWDHSSAREVCSDLLVRLSSNKSTQALFLSDDSIDALLATFLDLSLSTETREKVLTAFFNVVFDEQSNLEKLVRSGAIPGIIKLLYSASPDGKFTSLLMLKTLVVNGFEDIIFRNGGVVAIAQLLDANLHDLHYTEDYHFYKEVAKTLHELSVGRDDIKQKIIEADVIPKLVPLMEHRSNKLKSAVLKVIYGLAVNSSAKKAIIQAGVAPKLILLLYKNNRHAEFAATAVRNLAFDNEQTGAILVRGGAIEALMIIIQCNSSFDARKQALAAIVNLSNEPTTQAPEKLCSTGALDFFCEEVLTFSKSRKTNEFQWASWCAVVLHNLMEYEECYDKVVSALHRQAPNSQFKNKIKQLKDDEYKTWMAGLAAESQADFL